MFKTLSLWLLGALTLGLNGDVLAGKVIEKASTGSPVGRAAVPHTCSVNRPRSWNGSNIITMGVTSTPVGQRTDLTT